MESSTRNNEKIGGHHVNKRKRKCTDLKESKSFSNKAISLNSNSSKTKADDHLDVPTRAIGGDGHFYVCMKCEDVGQLICCDTCSCTYHLYCLNPPLESTPEGDWYCPNCSDNDNLLNPALNLENAISNKGLSLNKSSNSSSHCSLCSKIEKTLILNEDEVVISKPCSTDQPNLSVGFDKCAMEHRGEPSVPDAGIDGTIIRQTPNSEDSDKLLILRDVLQEAVQELGNTEQTNNEAEDTINQLVPVDAQSGQLQKHKSAKVHSKHKEKLILRITSKGVHSGSKLDLQRQSSDPAHAQSGHVQKDENANLHSRQQGKLILRNTSKGAHSGSKLDVQKQSSDPVDAQSGQVQKDENANLHSRQKGKLILRNTSKGAHSGSKLDLQKQSLDPVDAQSGLVQKDENANLHSRPKGKLILRNTRKGACSGSKLDVQKKSSDLSMVKYGESVRSDALANTMVADAQRSSVMTLSGQHVTTPSISLPPIVPNFPSHINADARRLSWMTLSGQNITNPNISLPKTNASAAAGFTSSMAYGKNIDTVPSGRPSGFLKRNAEKITWSGLELDALWVGVRRYGQEDWDTILADPSLRVLKNKTPQDLCMKWKEELPKIFSFQKPSSSLPSSVPAERLKPPVSNRKGIKTRDATTMQLLPPKFPFPSLKSGTLGSYDQGSSSSRASPSFPKVHDTDIVPPHWIPNLNMEPVVSELLFQTLKQRANPETKMRLIGMQAFPTPGVAMATHRRSSSNRTDQTNLLLGGHFPIRNASGGPSNTKPNPSQVKTDED